MTASTPRERRTSHRLRVAASVVVTVSLAACLAACTAASPASAPVSSPSPTAVPAPTAAIEVPVTSSAPRAAEPIAAPTRLRIGAIEVDMAITPVGVDEYGQMALPTDPAVAGWYRFGADADAEEGHTVVSAHVDSPQYPIGPLARLRELGAGTALTLTDDGGDEVGYTIESVTYYPKSELPVDDIFARDGEHAVLIITCGGPFDSSTGHYRDNVVAVARRA